MFVDDLGRCWQGMYPFDMEAIQHCAPDLQQSGVYEIFYKKQLAYVGISTTSMYDRLCKHYAGRGNWALGADQMQGRQGVPAELYRQSTDIAFDWEFAYHPCPGLVAQQIESYITVHQKPPFNVKVEWANLIESIAIH